MDIIVYSPITAYNVVMDSHIPM